MERRQLERDGAERLRRIDFLREVPLGRRRELARLADEVTAGAGETLIHQGEPGYEFMMLEQGEAEVIQDGEPIGVMGPGDSFGELAVLGDGGPRTASVVARSDLQAIVLTARFVRDLHDRLPAAGREIDRIAAERRERDARRGRVSSPPASDGRSPGAP